MLEAMAEVEKKMEMRLEML
jgi:hypothetical protein